MTEQELAIRLKALEDWRYTVDIDKARSDENKRYMNERFDRIEASLETLKGIWNKVIWLVASAIAVSFVTFIIKGGLNV